MTKKTPRTPNTDGLRAAARNKSEGARQRVLEAIQRLQDDRATVNMNSVAREASVTRGYLYTQTDLRERIDSLRRGQDQARLVLVSYGDMDRKKTDKSKDVLLEAKERKIKALEAEVKRLAEENRKLHGKLYEQV